MSFRTACALAGACVLGTAQASAEDACKLEPLGTVEVVAVRDGRTLLLRDGSELRLAAIETPASGQATLAALAGRQTLTLKQLKADERDRYGRRVAFAFLPNSTQSLQVALLEQGQARVSARVGDKLCAEALLASERAARAANRGLWADPNFAPLPADHMAELMAKKGHFALVEGKVVSVRQSGSTIYVNFGRQWTQGFSVTIASRLGKAFAAAGVEPKKLEGRRVRVRGWVEQRNAPIIDAAAPEQIELTD